MTAFLQWLGDLQAYIWFIGSAGLAGFVAALRKAAKQLGLDLASAFLWLFRRKVRKTILGYVNLRRYCKLVLAASKTEYLRVPGADKTMALRTDELFVKLRLDAAANTSTTYTTDHILEAGSRIMVVGDPGSGKSSLVKRVFRDLCRVAIASPRGARIPVVVELKELSKEMAGKKAKDWLLEYIRGRVAEVQGHKMADFFDLYAGQNGIVLLLDGLDEVASSECAPVVEHLNRLSRALAGMGADNMVVLTMRVQFYRQIHRQLEEEFPVTLHVKPFRPEDVYEFLCRWFKGPAGLRSASRLYGELGERPSLREMCTNPLILAMYAASHRDVSDTDLPDTRSEFYHSVVEELLIRRGSEQVGNRRGRISRKEIRYAILGKMAVANLLDFDQPANSIPLAAALDAVKQVLKIKNRDEAQDVLDELAPATGIVDTERPGESIRFKHLTFCEYLAAVELVENHQRGWQELIAKHGAAFTADTYSEARLVEVIPFAAAMLQRKDRDAALSDVYRLGQRDLYARCLIETQRFDHENWLDYLAAERAWLMDRPYEEWDAYWLSRLQIYQTALAESSHSLRDESAAAGVDRLFLDLIADQRERLVALFSSYASENPRGAFRLSEACGVDLVKEAPELLVRECGNPPFLASCIDAASSAQADVARWSAIFVAAGLRSTLAAQTLSEHDVPATWYGSGTAPARLENWDGVAGQRKPTRPSLYSFSISLVRSQLRGGEAGPMSENLNPLGYSGPPRFLVSDWICAAAMVIALIVWILGYTGLVMRFDGGWGLILSVVAAQLVFMLAFLVIAGTCRRLRAFRSLVNLDELGKVMFGALPVRGPTMSKATRYGLNLFAPRLARAIREQVWGPDTLAEEQDEEGLSPAAVAVSR